MNLVVETFQNGERWLAVICPAGSLMSEGRVGAGVTERAAVQQAVNAYYKNDSEPWLGTGQPGTQEGRIAAALPNLSTPTPAERRGALNHSLGRVYTTNLQRALLVTAIENREEVVMEYSDASETRTERTIRPVKIETRRPGSGFSEDYLIAVDVEKDEPRTFRFSRIKSVGKVVA